MSRKEDSKPPSSDRSRQTPNKPTPTSSKIHMEFIPSPRKTSKLDLTYKNIEDEEFPRGYTLESLSSPTKDENHSGVRSNELRRERKLSLVAQFDEFMRAFDEHCCNDITAEFLQFAEHQELCRLEWLKSVQECQRLQLELDKANHELGDFQTKLKNARRLLDQERKLRRKTEEELINIEQQVITAREIFNEKNWKIPESTRDKLSFLTGTQSKEKTIFATGTRLNTISEVNSADINSTASLLSDFSYSRSDGELDASTVFKIKSEEWKPPKPVKKDPKSPRIHNTSTSTRKIVEINPTDKIVATTTLAMSKHGPITATSIIEAVPQSESDTSSQVTEIRDEIAEILPRNKESISSPTISSTRAHCFTSKAVLCPDICSACKSRIRFGKVVAKCKYCRGICHMQCKNLLSVPCVPVLNILNKKPTIGTVADYASSIPPMVPALIINCVNEIELRGLKEVGLYRIPGVEKDIKLLKEKFLRNKMIPNLSNIDVHVLCGVIKDFLRSLTEPLVTNSLRKDFIQAAEAKDEMDVMSCLYQAISQLPQPNRDTMSYMMLHLNRVAASRDCKMPTSNLAKIFAPTIIGYSQNIEPHNLLKETKQQFLAMDYLMKISVDFWSAYIKLDSAASTPKNKNVFLTPSTESSTRRKFFSPDGGSSASSSRKRKKYFGTPPTSKN